MKTIMRIPIMKFGFLAIAAGSMILFTACQQEDLTANDNENLTFTNETQNRGPGPSANGQGTLSLEGIPPVGEGFRHFSFHAREKNNGSVNGSGVLTYVGGVRNISFDIDCLMVDGNTATMSGVVTRDNQFPERVGYGCWFEVEDNGEGNNADPDRITLWLSSASSLDCVEDDFGLVFYDIEGGNIQVRD